MIIKVTPGEDSMATEKILSEVEDGIGRLIFNNPARHNAVSLDMWHSAEEVLKTFENDNAIRVVVLSGAGGKSFVSGADISEFGTERANKKAIKQYNQRVSIVNSFITNMSKPTIAQIDGYCIGGGLGLAVCCDIRFCSQKSRFSLPAAKLGLGYPFDNLKRLVDLVGPAVTSDITFSARQLDSSEALRVGLVQKILDDNLHQFVDDYAVLISKNAPLTIKSMKFNIRETQKDQNDRNLEMVKLLVDNAFSSDDYIEGRTAFMEKRSPLFQGK